jgi:hypothetical protein
MEGYDMKGRNYKTVGFIKALSIIVVIGILTVAIIPEMRNRLFTSVKEKDTNNSSHEKGERWVSLQQFEQELRTKQEEKNAEEKQQGPVAKTTEDENSLPNTRNEIKLSEVTPQDAVKQVLEATALLPTEQCAKIISTYALCGDMLITPTVSEASQVCQYAKKDGVPTAADMEKTTYEQVSNDGYTAIVTVTNRSGKKFEVKTIKRGNVWKVVL